MSCKSRTHRGHYQRWKKPPAKHNYTIQSSSAQEKNKANVPAIARSRSAARVWRGTYRGRKNTGQVRYNNLL